MKRLLFLMLILACALLLFVSCGGGETTTAEQTTESTETTEEETTATVTTEKAEVAFVEKGEPAFKMVIPPSLGQDDTVLAGITAFRDAFSTEGLTKPSTATSVQEGVFSLVLTLDEALSVAASVMHWDLSLEGDLLTLTAGSKEALVSGLEYISATYVTGKGTDTTIPGDLAVVGAIDMTYSDAIDKTYAEMASDMFASFNDAYWVNNRWVDGNAFWDTAEILEVYIDAYEATGDESIKDMMVKFANMFLMKYKKDFSYNDYNDDIMWICIGLSRIYLLTGEETFKTVAKNNFDATYARAYNDTLGGGLWWKENEAVMSKNSCVNCPGAIAACLLGEITGEESYFEKAKGLIDWELTYMFEANTGRVYDAYNVEGKINKWASTYNQGTFIGACTYLYKHYGNERYLAYASKAAEYAMKNFTNNQYGVIDNSETGGNDLPGFKGILARWLYRYAKETNDLEILAFLQKNADVVYTHRNTSGLCWTSWKDQTPEDLSDRIAFGQSTAVSLLYNCQPWWE